jgi:HK97 gp10 family phage protein
MGRGAGFQIDPHFARALLRAESLFDVLLPKGEKVAEVARRLAPDDPATTTDDLRSSIKVESVRRERGVAVRVRASDWKAHWKEFGSSREQAKPFLRPAVEQVVGPLEASE